MSRQAAIALALFSAFVGAASMFVLLTFNERLEQRSWTRYWATREAAGLPAEDENGVQPAERVRESGA